MDQLGVVEVVVVADSPLDFVVLNWLILVHVVVGVVAYLRNFSVSVEN